MCHGREEIRLGRETIDVRDKRESEWAGAGHETIKNGMEENFGSGWKGQFHLAFCRLTVADSLFMGKYIYISG